MEPAATPIERTGPNSARAAREYPLSPEEVLGAVRRAVEGLPRWTLASADETGLRAVRRTLLFRFPDGISVACSPSRDGVRTTFESASRLGRSDLGQNPRNLRELMEAVDREVRRGA